MRFDRITVDTSQMGGVPCIRDIRISVSAIAEMIADGMAIVSVKTA